MIAQDVLDLARHSELGNTAFKILSDENTAAIVSFINMGMIELYKRFVLRTEELILELEDNVTMYTLPSDFMYIIEAYKEVYEYSQFIQKQIPVNDEDSPESIFFPNHTQIQVPAPSTGAFISIIYVAKPQKVTVAALDQELDLPEVLIECLLHYIGYRGHLSIRGDGQSENNAHFARFERSVVKAKELSVTTATDSYGMSERLSNRGFV